MTSLLMPPRKPPTNFTRPSTGRDSIPWSQMFVLWFMFLKSKPARSRSTTQWLATLSCPYAVFASNVRFVLKQPCNLYRFFPILFYFSGMDESISTVLTILCNHSFHGSCLAQWEDSTCPVCRHVQGINSICRFFWFDIQRGQKKYFWNFLIT